MHTSQSSLGILSETLSECHFSLRVAGPVALIVLPLEALQTPFLDMDVVHHKCSNDLYWELSGPLHQLNASTISVSPLDRYRTNRLVLNHL